MHSGRKPIALKRALAGKDDKFGGSMNRTGEFLIKNGWWVLGPTVAGRANRLSHTFRSRPNHARCHHPLWKRSDCGREKMCAALHRRSQSWREQA